MVARDAQHRGRGPTPWTAPSRSDAPPAKEEGCPSSETPPTKSGDPKIGRPRKSSKAAAIGEHRGSPTVADFQQFHSLSSASRRRLLLLRQTGGCRRVWRRFPFIFQEF